MLIQIAINSFGLVYGIVLCYVLNVFFQSAPGAQINRINRDYIVLLFSCILSLLIALGVLTSLYIFGNYQLTETISVLISVLLFFLSVLGGYYIYWMIRIYL
jgi:hypothetical protein